MNKSSVVYLNNFKSPNQVPFYERRWFLLSGRIISAVIAKIPPLNRRISKTIPFLDGRIPTLYHAGKYVEALELSISGLKKCNLNDETDHYYWWSFMSYAVYCAWELNNPNLMTSLVSIAEKGFEPFEGYRVSYCFCKFSRFKFDQKDYDSAFRFAEVAKKADDESGEAYYLLGFYELFINEKDPVELFRAAIERDHKTLNMIVDHPSIKEFPAIIERVKKLKTITSKSPNKAHARGRS